MNAEQIAFAALNLPWEQVESQARQVAYKAAELIQQMAMVPKNNSYGNSPEEIAERNTMAQAGIAAALRSSTAGEPADEPEPELLTVMPVAPAPAPADPAPADPAPGGTDEQAN